jgi:hypothetical protein
MAENKTKKSTRSPDEKKLFRSRTDINKARRAKAYAKWLADPKREQRRLIREGKNLAKRAAHAAMRNYKPGPSLIDPKPEIPTVIIKVYEGKDYHELTVEQVVDGPRDTSKLPKEHKQGAYGSLISNGGVTFLTRAGKKWHMKFSEFQFVINHKF